MKENKYYCYKCGGLLEEKRVDEIVKVKCTKCGDSWSYPYEKCYDCWWDFPIRHTGCGGLIHAHYIDESYDSIYMNYFCDKCGKTWIDTEDALECGETLE